MIGRYNEDSGEFVCSVEEHGIKMYIYLYSGEIRFKFSDGLNYSIEDLKKNVPGSKFTIMADRFIINYNRDRKINNLFDEILNVE